MSIRLSGCNLFHHAGHVDICVVVLADLDIEAEGRKPKFLQLVDSKGVNIQHIGKNGFASFPIPVPPLAEQREITRHIETAFAKIDHLKAEAAKTLKLPDHKGSDGRATADLARHAILLRK